MVLGFLIWCIMSLAASVSAENVVAIISVEDLVIFSSEALEAARNYENKLCKFIIYYLFSTSGN